MEIFKITWKKWKGVIKKKYYGRNTVDHYACKICVVVVMFVIIWKWTKVSSCVFEAAQCFALYWNHSLNTGKKDKIWLCYDLLIMIIISFSLVGWIKERNGPLFAFVWCTLVVIYITAIGISDIILKCRASWFDSFFSSKNNSVVCIST